MTADHYANELRNLVAADFGPENVGHDITHLDRVWVNCQMIANDEGGDRDVLAAAAYLHDYHRVLERRTGDTVRPHEALADAAAALDGVGFPAQKRELVLDCIRASGNHSFSADSAMIAGVEPQILKDADNLDAIGAIGIARAFMFGAELGEPIWDPDAPIAEIYTPGHSHSIVHHFHEKLLRLKEDMHTLTGRRIANERDAFMREFLQRLFSEAGIVVPV